jgi:putative membrane protein insertion efficiency factor
MTPSGAPVTLSPAARGARAVVRGYQQLRAGRPSPCRHIPSCSSYAIEAIETHGAARGSWLALRRLGRCRPGGTWGYDPVPEPASPALPAPRGAGHAGGSA